MLATLQYLSWHTCGLTIAHWSGIPHTLKLQGRAAERFDELSSRAQAEQSRVSPSAYLRCCPRYAGPELVWTSATCGVVVSFRSQKDWTHNRSRPIQTPSVRERTACKKASPSLRQ